MTLFFLIPEGILQHRPLPDLPSSADDVGGGIRDLPGSLGSGFSLLDGSLQRWTSRENLLTAANDEDPQLFVALYDFQAGGENQLSLKKAEQVSPLFGLLCSTCPLRTFLFEHLFGTKDLFRRCCQIHGIRTNSFIQRNILINILK